MDSKPKVDPGWNDPPMLNYSPDNPPPKSRIMSKRVAFPVFGNSSTTNSPILTGVAPNPSMCPPVPSVQSVGISPPSGLPIPKTKNALIYLGRDRVRDILGKYLKEEDLQKLSDSWDREFSVLMKTEMSLLAQHLSSNNSTEFNQIKNKLLSEYKSECEPWLENINL